MDLINTNFDMMINWKQAREAAVENNELLCITYHQVSNPQDSTYNAVSDAHLIE